MYKIDKDNRDLWNLIESIKISRQLTKYDRITVEKIREVVFNSSNGVNMNDRYRRAWELSHTISCTTYKPVFLGKLEEKLNNR